MCAISGVWNLPYHEDILQKMLKTMERRGPDGSGIFRGREGALLHSRLAIIDPQGGRQPMCCSWQGENYTIVYNGELYNTEELRRELESLGHTFQGWSDTEVVLHAYAQWKENCLDRFNGIFALAVWEEKNGRLFLARDRMGVKPLFYTRLREGIVFASEIKTILAFPGVKPRLDAPGAAQIVMLGPGRIPGSGIFRNVRELEPGQCASFENGKFRVWNYWQLKDRPMEDTFSEAVEKVRYLVMDAVKRQMVSDVPMGTFLSGGLDSSLISAICAREMETRGEILPTFSVDYEGNSEFFIPGKFQPESDEAYIQIMAQTLGSQHSKTVLSTQALVDGLEAAVDARDLPGMADVDISLLLFSGEIRKHVKMALSGECADEIFGGYPWFRDPEVDWAKGFPWAQNTPYRSSLLHPDISRQLNPEEMIADELHRCRGNSDILPGTSDRDRRTKEMVNLNFRWFMQTLLDRKDRMSMYHGLEVRVPFCDYRIAEYLYTVPWAWKEHGGREKGLLRKAVEGILPEKVLYRKKSPYPKTVDPEYENAMAGRLKLLLENDGAPVFQLFRKEGVRQLLTEEFLWPWYGQLMRRPQLMAYLLQVNYWMERYHLELEF